MPHLAKLRPRCLEFRTPRRYMTALRHSLVNRAISWAGLTVFSACTFSGCTVGSSATPGRSVATPPPPFPAGSEVVARFAHQDFCKDVTAMMEVLIDGEPGSVKLRVRRKNSPQGASTLLEVISPREESDKALLAREEADRPAEVFAYLSGLQEIASFPPSREVIIRNVRVTVQEMIGLELGMYSHDVMGESNANGVPVYEVKSIAEPDINTRYRIINGLYRKDNLMPVSLALYSQTGEAVKRIQFTKIEQQQGYWTVVETAIEDLLQKRQAYLKITEIQYDQKLPDSIFSEAYLMKLVRAPR